MNGAVRKVASEQESANSQKRWASTWQLMLTARLAGAGWNFPTRPAVAADGMTTNTDCWACAMVNCYLVTCEVAGQLAVVVGTDGMTSEVLHLLVLTVIATREAGGLVETMEVLEKSWNQASMDDCLALDQGLRYPDDPDNPLACLVVVRTAVTKYCHVEEVVNCCCCCCCPDCPGSA